MFGKIKWLFLILPVILFMTCELGDDIESKKDPDSVTLSFDANGGGGTVPPSITGKIGAGIILPNGSTISMANHIFDGWNDNSGIYYPAGATFTLPISDTTLYAVWSLPEEILIYREYTIGNLSFESGGLGTTWTSYRIIDNLTSYIERDRFDIALLKSQGYTNVTLRYNYIMSVWGDIEYELRLLNITKPEIEPLASSGGKRSGNNSRYNRGIVCTVDLSEIEISNTFDDLEIQVRSRKLNALWGGDFRILPDRKLIITFSKP